MSFPCLLGLNADGYISAAVFGYVLELHTGVEAAVPVDEYFLFAYLAKAGLFVPDSINFRGELIHEQIGDRSYLPPLLAHHVAKAVGVARVEERVHSRRDLLCSELFEIQDIVVQLWERLLGIDELHQRLRLIFQQQFQVRIEESGICSALGTIPAVVRHIDDNAPALAPFQEVLVEKRAVGSDDEAVRSECFDVIFYGVLIQQRLASEEVYRIRITAAVYEVRYLIAGLAADAAVFRIKMPLVAIAAPELAFIRDTYSIVHFILDVYDLYDKIEEDVLVELGLLILQLDELRSEEFFSCLIGYIRDNKSVFGMIFSHNGTNDLREKFGKLMEGLFRKLISEQKDSRLNDGHIEYLSCYRAQGCIAVVEKCVLGDLSEPESFIVGILSDLDKNTENFIMKN